jgi:CPA1 family monovalent cation:H+ antiporter
MILESATLALLAVVLVAAGHVCARFTRSAQEMWWLAFGCLVAFGESGWGVGPGLSTATISAALHDVGLPLLVFAAAYSIDRRCMGLHRVPVVVLPLVSVTIAAGAIAWALSDTTLVHPAMPWAAALALGAVLAPTDAGAVTAQLALRAPRGIRMLLNGEAVIAAAIAYAIVDAAVAAASTPPDPVLVGALIALRVAAGAAIGAAFGWLGAEAVRRLPSESLSHWAVPLAGLAAYLGADALGASGVTACLLAGLLLARRPEGAVSAPFWAPLGQGMRAVVFLAAGYLAPGLDFGAALPLLAPALLLTYATRFTAVYLVTSVIHALTRFAITTREQALISVWSVRGATTLGLAFALPPTLPLAGTIQSTALLVVALDLLVITPATPWLARRFANHAPRQSMIVGRRTIAH